MQGQTGLRVVGQYGLPGARWREQRQLLRELVISDGGSTDATRAVADEAGAIWVSGPPGRGGQLGRGVAASEGDWLLVLHADTWLAPVSRMKT